MVQLCCTNRLRGSTPDFLSGFTALAFVSPETTTRQWCYLSIAGTANVLWDRMPGPSQPPTWRARRLRLSDLYPLTNLV